MVSLTEASSQAADELEVEGTCWRAVLRILASGGCCLGHAREIAEGTEMYLKTTSKPVGRWRLSKDEWSRLITIAGGSSNTMQDFMVIQSR